MGQYSLWRTQERSTLAASGLRIGMRLFVWVMTTRCGCKAVLCCERGDSMSSQKPPNATVRQKGVVGHKIPTVFAYEAVISTQLIRSQFVWNAEPLSDAVVSAVRTRLFYQPNATSSVASGRIGLTILGRDVRDENITAMEAWFRQKYAWTLSLPKVNSYKTFECSCELRTDSQVIWGFTQQSGGTDLPGLSLDVNGEDLSLDDFLRSVIRLDISRRLEALA